MYRLKIDGEKVELIRNKRKGITLKIGKAEIGKECKGCFFDQSCQNLCLNWSMHIEGFKRKYNIDNTLCEVIESEIDIEEDILRINFKKWE